MKITIDGMAWLPKADLSSEQLSWLKKTLTITQKVSREYANRSKPAIVELWKETEAAIGIPREFFLEKMTKGHEIDYKVSRGLPWPNRLEPEPIDGKLPEWAYHRSDDPSELTLFDTEKNQLVLLRNEQAEAMQSTLEHLGNKPMAGGLIQAPTGWGKTTFVLALLHKMKMRTAVLVHREFLANQWRKRINRFLPDCKVGLVAGNKWDEEDCHVCLVMIETIASWATKNKIKEEFPNIFGILAADECVDGNALVHTDNGPMTLRDIVNSNTNIRVVSYNDATKCFEYKKVKNKWNKGKKKVLIIRTKENTIKVTPEHLIMTKSGWVEARNLAKGNQILNMTPEDIGISPLKVKNPLNLVNVLSHTSQNISDINYTEIVDILDGDEVEVYDIEVEDNHNFIANNMVVHNCHRASAPLWSQALPVFNSAYRIGVSAHPKRSDGLDAAIFYHIGQKIYTGTTMMMTPKVRRVWTNFKIDHPRLNVSMLSMEFAFKYMAKDETYNQDVVNQIKLAFEAKRKILVYSHTIDHLKTLKKMLDVQLKDTGATIDFYIGGMKEEQLDAAAECSIILASYQMAKDSLDIPALDTVVLAGPIRNPQQPAGRACREFEGKKPPIVVDMRADNVPVFRSYAESRDNAYARLYNDDFLTKKLDIKTT
jgi:superfamily II DNA or RNA helicase